MRWGCGWAAFLNVQDRLWPYFVGCSTKWSTTPPNPQSIMVWAGVPWWVSEGQISRPGWVSKSLQKSFLPGLNHHGVTDGQTESCDWESSSQSPEVLSKNILIVFSKFPLLCSPHCMAPTGHYLPLRPALCCQLEEIKLFMDFVPISLP